jgi:hypothetical protein
VLSAPGEWPRRRGTWKSGCPPGMGRSEWTESNDVRGGLLKVLFAWSGLR